MTGKFQTGGANSDAKFHSDQAICSSTVTLPPHLRACDRETAFVTTEDGSLNWIDYLIKTCVKANINPDHQPHTRHSEHFIPESMRPPYGGSSMRIIKKSRLLPGHCNEQKSLPWPQILWVHTCVLMLYRLPQNNTNFWNLRFCEINGGHLMQRSKTVATHFYKWLSMAYEIRIK